MTTHTSDHSHHSHGVTRVLVVDDHMTFSDLLSMALSGEDDLECVGTAHDRSSALELARSERPDVVLMDVALGHDNGLQVTAELTREYPALRVVVLTANANRELMMQAAAADASCLLLKNGALPDVLRALRTSRRGGFVVGPDLLQSLMAQTSEHSPNEPPLPSLTPRELAVIKLLASGKDTHTIARELNLSVHTCRGYVKSLLYKLDAHSQLEAAAIAIRRGIVDV